MTRGPMTKEEALHWKAGWQALAERERAELRRQSPEEKFRDLAFLMESVDLFDFSKLELEDEVVRQRWALLRSLSLPR